MERIVLLVHGYKRPNKHDFDEFFKYCQEKIDEKIDEKMVKLYWFDNLNSNTIGPNKFINNFKAELKKYQDKEIILISYSMGSSLSLVCSKEFPNIKKIIAIYPTFYINFGYWIKKLKNGFLTKRKIKKKIGKKRYKKLENNYHNRINEKYPLRLTLSIELLRGKLKRKLKPLSNKEIIVFFNKDDKINQTNHSFKKIENKLNKKNEIKYYWIPDSHFTILDKNSKELFEKIIQLVK